MCADLDSLREKFHSMQPFFTLDEEEITIPKDATSMMLSFIDLFSHSHMGDEVGIDSSKGITESQKVKRVKQLSQDE